MTTPLQLIPSEIPVPGGRLVPVERRGFCANWDAETGCYIIDDGALGVFVSDPSLEELEPSLRQEIAFLWSCYACELDEHLSPPAQAVAAALRRTFRFTPSA